MVDIPRTIFSHNTDIGQTGHLWMNTTKQKKIPMVFRSGIEFASL